MTTKTIWHLALAASVAASFTACSSKSEPRDVTVSWSDVKQTMEGFGASAAFFGGKISEAQADQLFDAKKGLGLSMLRIMIGVPADTKGDGSEPTDGTANPVPTAPEVATAQQAIARGCNVWAAAWTPPPIWKSTNNKNGSGSTFDSNKLLPEHYQDFANYLTSFVDMMAAANPPVPLMALSPANEPDYVATWDNAQWTGDELISFIGQNLGPTLAAKYPSVKIVAPETANCPDCDKYVDPLLANPTASSYVPVIAAHGYGPPTGNYDKPRKAGKSFWETEWSQENKSAMGDTPDPTMVSAMDMMKHMHGDLVTSQMNAWNWWAIYITADGLNDDKRLNPAFIQPDVNFDKPYMFKRGYAFGNWSKFVRPGFQRISSTDRPGAGVLTEAYRDATHIAIIAINTKPTTMTQKFILSGNEMGTITPWVTSADDSLAPKDAITATDNTFSFDLPPNSVVTFVNWDATKETPGQTTTVPDGGADGPKPGTLDCTAPVVPNNVVNGGVTDFTDWKASMGKWGNTTNGLYGAVYAYPGTMGSTMSVVVDPSKDMHMTGMVTPNDYAGAGLSYSVCSTVASFTQVQFTVAGSAPGCDLQLQIKTFAQQPITQTPPGGCNPDGSSCYNFPALKKIAVPTVTPQTIAVPLASFSGWSPEDATQVIGLQWQFTVASKPTTDVDAAAPDADVSPPDADVDATAPDAEIVVDATVPDVDAGATDAGATNCTVDVTVTGIKFLP